MLIATVRGKRGAAGFSLVELMIAIVVGMIVIGAVLAFTISTIRAYSQNIGSTRLTQDLRTSMNVAVRELRRAGFDSGSVSRVMTDTNPSNFNSVTIDGNCVKYEYDRGEGGMGGTPAATEVRGIRWNTTTGALQMNASSAVIDCTDASDAWVDVSDPAVVEVTKFKPTIYRTRFCTDLGSTTNPVTSVTTYQIATGSVRNLGLCLRGRLRADSTVERQVGNLVRIRAEDLQFVMNSTTACPSSSAVDPVPTLTVFNQECANSP